MSIAVEQQSPETASERQPDINEKLVETVYSATVAKIKEHYHIPSSTYRVQLNRYFTFRQATEQIDYLERLGISDLYTSPFFKARPESLHGYDIVNHNELNPTIGTEEDYGRMVAGLRKQGMSLLLDIVPNHMGIGEESNIWWMDVLENGRSSVYAPYFDIDWDPINTKLTNKVLLPILGDQYGRTLENKELQVSFVPNEGRFYLSYYDKVFPLNPGSYTDILEPNKEQLITELGPDSEAGIEYQSILTAINNLPARNETEPDRTAERNREKEVIKRRLTTLCANELRIRRFIEHNVQWLNGTAGDPHSFDPLDNLLERQAYRLSFWRVATEEINYRRFFDVNELAAIRIDRPEVFAEAHRLIMRLLSEHKLDGLRVDHVDGLRDPAGYLGELQRAYFLATCRAEIEKRTDRLEGIDRAELERALLQCFEAGGSPGTSGVLHKPLYVVVEKIFTRGESLPSGWEAYGTTGYEFTNAVNGLFVGSSNVKAMDETYAGFIGEKLSFADLAYESKKQIMRQALSSEITMLTNMLNRLSQSDRRYRDFTINSIRNAIREVIACFPVYRTYITPEQETVDKRDRAVIETAVSRAKKRNPATDPTIFDFLREILLLDGFEDTSTEHCQACYDFVMKFQQVTGPVIAKGLEDTAFYVYNRLISLNEVGGEPDLFGTSPAAFHKQQIERLQGHPHSLLTTSTHDTKRSEDVRARIAVLSEMPKEWRTAVRRWARLNRKHKKTVEGQLAPSPNEEYFIYQTLLGVWPFNDQMGKREQHGLVERLQAYMRKAINEAKVNSSWVNTNEPYLAAVSDFIAAILRADEHNRFLADFLPFQKTVAHYGALNSLSQVLIKITSPGVPDIYQGNEVWDLSLVDPDNRRPVDYKAHRRMLDQVERVKDPQGAEALLQSKEDGRIKLFVTSRALRFRKDHDALFKHGAYTPIEAEGKHKDNLMAFARTHKDATAITVAPRLVSHLAKTGERATPTGQTMSGSWLPLPGFGVGDRVRNVFTGEEIEAQAHEGGAAIPLENLLAHFPVALLEKL